MGREYMAGWLAGFTRRVDGKFVGYSREWWRGYHAGRARMTRRTES